MPEEAPSVTKIAMHRIILARKTEKKHAKTGEPIYERVVPPIGQPFKFTQDEVEAAKKSAPGALRDPKNEAMPDASDESDQGAAAAAAAAMMAQKALTAAGDAAVTAAEAVNGRNKGRNKQAGNGADDGNDQSEPDDKALGL